MNKERIEEILQEESTKTVKGDTLWMGLMIVKRFLENQDAVVHAINNMVYSVTLEEMVEAEFTESQVINLRDFGWDLVPSVDGKTKRLAYYVN